MVDQLRRRPTQPSGIARRQLGAPGTPQGTAGFGHADQFAHHGHRQRIGEVRDEVDGPRLAGLDAKILQQAFGDALDTGPQAVHTPRGERPRHQPPHASVPGPIHVQEGVREVPVDAGGQAHRLHTRGLQIRARVTGDRFWRVDEPGVAQQVPDVLVPGDDPDRGAVGKPARATGPCSRTRPYPVKGSASKSGVGRHNSGGACVMCPLSGAGSVPADPGGGGSTVLSPGGHDRKAGGSLAVV